MFSRSSGSESSEDYKETIPEEIFIWFLKLPREKVNRKILFWLSTFSTLTSPQNLFSNESQRKMLLEIDMELGALEY